MHVPRPREQVFAFFGGAARPLVNRELARISAFWPRIVSQRFARAI